MPLDYPCCNTNDIATEPRLPPFIIIVGVLVVGVILAILVTHLIVFLLLPVTVVIVIEATVIVVAST